MYFGEVVLFVSFSRPCLLHHDCGGGDCRRIYDGVDWKYGRGVVNRCDTPSRGSQYVPHSNTSAEEEDLVASAGIGSSSPGHGGFLRQMLDDVMNGGLRSPLESDVAEVSDGANSVAPPGGGVGELLTPGEVAALFRVDRSTVLRWAKAGKIGFTTTMGGHRRYHRAEISALLECLRSPGPTSPV